MRSFTDVKSRLRGDVLELSAAQISKKLIAHFHGGHEQIGFAVIVDVGERGRDRDFVGEANSGRGSNVLEFPAAEISPELTFAELIHEIQIELAVAINIRDGETIAVIIVNSQVILVRIIHGMMLETNPAFLIPILKLKPVKNIPRLSL